MEIGKWKMLTVSLVLLCALTIPVFAYMYRTSRQIPAGILITTPTVQIGVYWDMASTRPVTIVDFGAIPQPNYDLTMTKLLYIKNEGDVSLRIFWNSTLSLVTNELTEKWLSGSGTPWNGTWVLGPGGCNGFTYYLYIPKYVTIATYNWTLTVWGEY